MGRNGGEGEKSRLLDRVFACALGSTALHIELIRHPWRRDHSRAMPESGDDGEINAAARISWLIKANGGRSANMHDGSGL